MDPSLSFSDTVAFKPREYQLEMLRESLKHNIIVAMDTGSGRLTAVELTSAMLRMREELELNRAAGAIWFLCPTVALCEQQLRFIRSYLPSYSSRMLCGRDGIDAWTTQSIWDHALYAIRVVVCTHQVLLDGLSHGFLQLRDIPLIIFDEAHHCTGNHPSSRIMADFYHRLRNHDEISLPTKILGLTASPVVRTATGKKSLATVEQNLDSITRTPVLHRCELLQHVHKPEVSSVFFSNASSGDPQLLVTLKNLYAEQFGYDAELGGICINTEDPSQVAETARSWRCKIQNSMKRFLRTAINIHQDLGSWMCEFYISSCAHRGIHRLARDQIDESTENEQILFSSLLRHLDITPTPAKNGVHAAKLSTLVDLLVKEMKQDTTALVFVKTRTETFLLASFLSMHPALQGIVKTGTCVGTSQVNQQSFSEVVDTKDQTKTLNEFQKGQINLLIATSVCDEGLDFRDCNLVVCFELPPNLKSFIQRRGRARQERSKFILVVPEGESDRLAKWQQLEQQMVELYMDDVRALEQIAEEEQSEQEDSEFVIQSTGARLSYNNATQHLQHFCDKLPQAAHTRFAPTYIFEKIGKLFKCNVLLPISINASIREFESIKACKSQRAARRDAAFQACIGLYQAQLINDHLLPSPAADTDIVVGYEKIAKRPKFSQVDNQIDVWRALATKWQDGKCMRYFKVLMTHSDQSPDLELIMIAPNLKYPRNIQLHLSRESVCDVSFKRGPRVLLDPFLEEQANKITRLILASTFERRMDKDKMGFPLLFVPSGIEDTRIWLQSHEGTFPASELVDRAVIARGLVRHRENYGKKYEFLQLESCSPSEEFPLGLKLRCGRFSKRINFLAAGTTGLSSKESQTDYLDPQRCDIDHLPFEYAKFGRFIPSIMHRIEIFLLAEDLCQTILAPVEFENTEIVLQAISTPLADPDHHYQRLEFLGDGVLKTLTAISLVSDHPNWHEGYLSNRKDLIVSNGRLAKAAEDTGLVRYIINKAFTGIKWRPLYNDEILSKAFIPQREMSTKVLADVVEALIGAAFLDGGLLKAVKAVQVFIPEINWKTTIESSRSILAAVPSYSSNSNFAPRFDNLERLLDHKFTYPMLLLEALTHPSHISESLCVSSYERFEFLGDALLDYIVTNAIYRHYTSLTVPYMHLLRTAAVNGSFLAFCALSKTVSVAVADEHTIPIKGRRHHHTDQSKAKGQSINNSLKFSERLLSLPLYIRYSPNRDLILALERTRGRFECLRNAISNALSSRTEPYPWRLFAAFDPEKVYSDVIESTLAAVWIDSGGSLAACEDLLRRLNILTWLEDALNNKRAVWHPKEEVAAVAAGERISYVVRKDGQANSQATGSSSVNPGPTQFEPHDSDMDTIEDYDAASLKVGEGRWACKIYISEQEIAEVRGWNRFEVEIAAAEEAIRILKHEKTGDNKAAKHSRTQDVDSHVEKSEHTKRIRCNDDEI